MILVPLLRNPHCLNSGRPSSIDFNTFNLEERFRGWCTLVLYFIIVQCLRSSIGNHHFPLSSVYLVYSTRAHYHMIEIRTLDAPVIQWIVLEFLGYV